MLFVHVFVEVLSIWAELSSSMTVTCPSLPTNQILTLKGLWDGPPPPSIDRQAPDIIYLNRYCSESTEATGSAIQDDGAGAHLLYNRLLGRACPFPVKAAPAGYTHCFCSVELKPIFSE